MKSTELKYWVSGIEVRRFYSYRYRKSVALVIMTGRIFRIGIMFSFIPTVFLSQQLSFFKLK